MGSSDNETVDCSVGSIVWVRRRNGSWWPGKILGTEDLSAAHLMSPRSGTPVKLLGREDASVDWYNLEKSKRVKAFRCGEFDGCIERAESAQGMPPKRREKYARREDAILHALELEKQLVESKHGQPIRISKSSDAAKEIVIPSRHLGNHGDKHIRSVQHLEEHDSTLEEMRIDRGEGSQLEGNNNPSQLIPRMRDLHDLGIGVPASKHKLSSAITSNGSGRHSLDENTQAPLSGTLITVNVIQTYNKGLLSRKRKSRSSFPDESLVRKHNKRHPLVQVEQSSPEAPNQQSLSTGEEHKAVAPHAEGRKTIGLPGKSTNCLDDKPATLNSTALLPSHFELNNHHPTALNKENMSRSSESTETDSSGPDSLNSDADGDMLGHSDATLDPRSLERLEAQAQHRNTSLDEPDNLAVANDAPGVGVFPQDFDLAGIGVSQWKIKGKRNTRRLGKKSTGSMYVKDGGGFDDGDLSEKIFGTQGKAADDYRGNLLISNSMSNCLDDTVHSTNEWDGEDCSNYLVDVDVKVQTSYQREHVPMISLMSKLNRKAIIGHPIQIEAVEDGSVEILLAADDTSLPPMWRTARRTSHNRLPRSTADLQYLNQDKKGKEMYMASSGHKKFFRKPLQKKRLSSGQKTKALSSIGVEQKGGENKRHGLIKVESGRPPGVACIPVKLVFSRLFEELLGRR